MHDKWSMLLASIIRKIVLPGIAVLGMFGFATAQEPEPTTGPESLRLPEVVITGIDRSKIQRMIPKVELAPELTVVTSTLRDRSDDLVQQGDLTFRRQIPQAEELYMEALAVDSTNSSAYLRLGDVYRAQKKYVEAAQAYQQALTLDANLVNASYHLALLYELYVQDLSQALEHYQNYQQAGGADPRVKIWIRNIKRQLAPATPLNE